MFFATVYISNSLVLRVVFSIINISTLFTFYWPPALALSMSLLLISKIALNLDSIVIKLGFILEAIYYYSFTG